MYLSALAAPACFSHNLRCHTRTKLSRRAVGSILREASEALKGDDSRAARDLFEPRLAPEAGSRAGTLCVEANDTWPFPESAEVVGHLDPRHLLATIHKGMGYDADGDAGDVRILCSEGRVGEALEVLAEQSDPKGKVAELASCISKRLHHRHAGAFPRHHGGR